MAFSSVWTNFFMAYAAVMLGHRWMSKREFRQHPDKGRRYQALPLAYKFACWFMVMPLLAGTVVHEFLGALGLASFLVLESACIRWYRRAGLLR
ncbi:hypothetical protein [Massilia sp. ST3]|uniref:hypothetical protein n=1 Tax=Massilia sp. ST3 TaxID=2824903 RepID=UPI001B83689F|nr:hypothetical protein [Massilia sp. ST3]MBQ5946969.1 hypothetical protein [Massilia sp. ST3]